MCCMANDNHYGGLIFTNHALTRMRDRGLPKEKAWEAFRNPDTTGERKEGANEYKKRYDKYLVTLIAKQNERKEWIIISAWVDPPMPGSVDIKKQEDYRRFQKASFWGKLLMSLKKQIGL